MRRSTSIIVLGLLCLILWEIPARAENPDQEVLSGTVSNVPFPGTSLVDPLQQGARAPEHSTLKNQGGKDFLPSTSPRLQDEAFPKTPENPGTSPRSLGNLFDLERQEVLLKKEISIRKLEDQLKDHETVKKVIETGEKGSPITLLAAGVEGNRYAILEWTDGRRIRVRQGETLPDGSRVVRIDGTGVSVRSRGEFRTYPYGQSRDRRNGRGSSSFPGPGNFMTLPPPPSAGGHP